MFWAPMCGLLASDTISFLVDNKREKKESSYLLFFSGEWIRLGLSFYTIYIVVQGFVGSLSELVLHVQNVGQKSLDDPRGAVIFNFPYWWKILNETPKEINFGAVQFIYTIWRQTNKSNSNFIDNKDTMLLSMKKV